MKQPRANISKFIASSTLSSGITKKLSKEVAAYLLSENRTAELDPLLRDVWQFWNNQGYIEVLATSAFELSIKVEEDIILEIKKLYPQAKKIIITKQYDTSVIAGAKLELPHQQLDLTIRSKLNTFKQLSVS